MYAWTFLVPVVAVLVKAVRGALRDTSAMAGIALVILGVAIVNHPRAEPSPAQDAEEQPFSVAPPTPPTTEVP